MSHPGFSGSWAGEFNGSDAGTMLLEIGGQSRASCSGKASLTLGGLGRLSFHVTTEGKPSGPLQLMLVRTPPSPVLGKIHLLCWPEDDGGLCGRWKSEDGKSGGFALRQLKPFAVAKTPASASPAPPTPRAKPRLLSDESPAPPPPPPTPTTAQTRERRTVRPRKRSGQTVLLCSHAPSARQTVSGYLEKIGVVAVHFGEPADTDSPSDSETLENLAAETSCAIMLLTPEEKPPTTVRSKLRRPRPSQDAIWELGYLAARLGKDRLIVLTQGSPESPADVMGLDSDAIDSGEGWKLTLARKLRNAGYLIDLNGAL